jgi:hypothetical protein
MKCWVQVITVFDIPTGLHADGAQDPILKKCWSLVLDVWAVYQRYLIIASDATGAKENEKNETDKFQYKSSKVWAYKSRGDPAQWRQITS